MSPQEMHMTTPTDSSAAYGLYTTDETDPESLFGTLDEAVADYLDNGGYGNGVTASFEVVQFVVAPLDPKVLDGLAEELVARIEERLQELGCELEHPLDVERADFVAQARKLVETLVDANEANRLVEAERITIDPTTWVPKGTPKS